MWRSSRNSNAALAATTSAAKPDAEEANPAAVGKLLWVSMRARLSTPASARRESRHADTRASAAGEGASFKRNSSRFSDASNSTRVRVHNESSVMESEPVAGKFSAVSRLPQYLINAMFGCAWAIPAIASPFNGNCISSTETAYGGGVGGL